ncbi:hypothetical protein Tco_0637605 [Tanacetum coccineum]
MQTMARDDVTGIKRSRRDLYSDGVRNLVMASRRGQLKEDLESSTWRRRLDYKATGSKVQQEIAKEFATMMASGTVCATEVAALATNKMVQKYMHMNVTQTLYSSFMDISNVDHFMNILKDDISTIRELLDEYA